MYKATSNLVNMCIQIEFTERNKFTKRLTELLRVSVDFFYLSFFS